ncbi:MAG: DUF362 domain-containing protein [Euryarchaeota archaeon]|nr:DUF362 domain-containing protein [Euryarchaeota archaeon]
MSDVHIALESAETKCGFVRSALARHAGLFEGVRSVFIKPNLVSDEPYPTTTDPVVLDAVLTSLSSYNLDVAVGDGPAYDYSWHGKAGVISPDHPLRSVCNNHSVEWINLNQRDHVKQRLAHGVELSLSTVPRSYDVSIALPVLKRHITCTITGAVKNQFGLLDIRERGGLHRASADLDRSIAAIATTERCQLYILDAVETLLRAEERRHGGQKAFLGYMLASTDPVALDCAGFTLLKRRDRSLDSLDVRDVTHLSYAADYGAGNMDYELVDFWGAI